MSDRSQRSLRRRACLLALLLSAAGCQEPRIVFVGILVQPAQLAFNTTLPAPAVEQSVEITATGVGENLLIASIALAQGNDLTLPATELLTTDCQGNARPTAKPLLLAPGECARFFVHYAPTIAESISNTVVITSNATRTPVVKVPVTAVNEAPPEKCPAALLPVAQIAASSSVAGPLAPSGSTPPALVTLSGAASTATSGAAIIGYDWSLVSGPVAQPMSLADPTLPLDASAVGSYVVNLIVADSNGCLSPPVTFPFVVSIPPCYMIQPPTAGIEAFVGSTPLRSTGVLAETTVTLRSHSVQGTHGITSYHWTLLSAPPNNASAIVAAGASATLDCTEPGTYVVELTVADAGGCANPATLAIQVAPLPLTCGPATQFIYTIDGSAVLYRFSPATVTMTPLGTIRCPGTNPGSVGPNTMAVDRQGIAWVEYSNGHVFRVDTTTLECWATSFDPSRYTQTMLGWGSCFAASASAANGVTYYIGDGELATVSTQSMAITQIGAFTGLTSPGASATAELTGTPDGRLFGFFPGSPWVLAEINEGSGVILSQTPLPAITVNPNNWAFASWGNDFWFFAGGGSTTGVYRYDATSGVTTEVTTVAPLIVGAGVSPCVQL